MSALHKDLLAAQGMQSALIHQDLTVATVKKASLGMVTHVLVSYFLYSCNEKLLGDGGMV